MQSWIIITYMYTIIHDRLLSNHTSSFSLSLTHSLSLTDLQSNKIGFLSGIKSTLSFRPYTYLFLLELFSWLAVQFVQGNYALFIKYSLNLEDQYPYVIAVLLIATILWMPFWQLVMSRIGKKATFCVGMWVFMLVLLTQLFIDFAGEYVTFVVYPIAFVGGAGVSCAYLLPW